MSLDKAMKRLQFDSRLVEFNLRTGQIKKEELEKHLASLPDSAANAGKLEIEEKSSPTPNANDSH